MHYLKFGAQQAECWGAAVAISMVEAAVYLCAAPVLEEDANWSEDTDWKGDWDWHWAHRQGGENQGTWGRENGNPPPHQWQRLIYSSKQINNEGTAAGCKTQGGSVLLLVWALRGGGGLRQWRTLYPAYLFTLSLVRRRHISYHCLGHQSDCPHSWEPGKTPGCRVPGPKGPCWLLGFSLQTYMLPSLMVVSLVLNTIKYKRKK